MNLARLNQRYLDRVHSDNVRTHKIGETDGFTPEIAADLGFGPAIAQFDQSPQALASSVDESVTREEYIPVEKRPWGENILTLDEKRIGVRGIAAARDSWRRGA